MPGVRTKSKAPNIESECEKDDRDQASTTGWRGCARRGSGVAQRRRERLNMSESPNEGGGKTHRVETRLALCARRHADRDGDHGKPGVRQTRSPPTKRGAGRSGPRERLPQRRRDQRVGDPASKRTKSAASSVVFHDGMSGAFIAPSAAGFGELALSAMPERGDAGVRVRTPEGAEASSRRPHAPVDQHEATVPLAQARFQLIDDPSRLRVIPLPHPSERQMAT